MHAQMRIPRLLKFVCTYMIPDAHSALLILSFQSGMDPLVEVTSTVAAGGDWREWSADREFETNTMLLASLGDYVMVIL